VGLPGLHNDSSKASAAAHRVQAATTVLGIGLLALALWWLHHVLGQYRWQDIVVRVHAIRGSALASAALLAVAGYASLTLYELLGARFAGAKIPYYKVAVISFMAYAIGNNVGLNAVSGGAIRFRAYAVQGLSAKQVATVVAFGSVTFGLGAAFLLGLSLLSNGGMSGTALRIGPAYASACGALLLAAVCGYFALAFRRRESLRLGPFVVPVLKPLVAFAQIGVACADLLCTAGVLYVLLPRAAAIGFEAFAGVYLIAITAGIASSVPGGVGVFESVLFLLLPAVPPDRLLGSLLAYRALYYLIPFAAALALLGLHELRAHRRPMHAMLRLARRSLNAAAPQAAAIAVLGAGAMSLFCGVAPECARHAASMRRFVPLPVLALARVLLLAVGAALPIAAYGLYRRRRCAWRLTLWLLAAGIGLSLSQGLDYKATLVLAVVAGIVALYRIPDDYS